MTRPVAFQAHDVRLDERLDRLRNLWRLYGFELRMFDGHYVHARITICKWAIDGHLDMNTQIHGHWENSDEQWITAMKTNKNVYDLELNRGWGEDA